jgi:hypothetical protein
MEDELVQVLGLLLQVAHISCFSGPARDKPLL